MVDDTVGCGIVLAHVWDPIFGISVVWRVSLGWPVFAALSFSDLIAVFFFFNSPKGVLVIHAMFFFSFSVAA